MLGYQKTAAYISQIIILMLFLLSTSNTYALKTQHILNFRNAVAVVPTLRSDALAIIAVEDVLIYPQDQILQTVNKPQMSELAMRIQNFYPTIEADKILSTQMKKRKVVLTDPMILEVINALKERNIKTIGISTGWSGQYGNISSLEDWQVAELLSVGIDLSWSIPNYSSVVLEDYSTADPKRFPSFSEGVLFTCHMAQGEVLDSFLRKIKLRPGQIFLITNVNRHADSISYFCQKNNIAITAMVYKTVEQTTKLTPLNLDRATLQYNILCDQKTWLNDAEADKLLPTTTPNQNTKLQNNQNLNDQPLSDANCINPDQNNNESIIHNNEINSLMSVINERDTKK